MKRHRYAARSHCRRENRALYLSQLILRDDPAVLREDDRIAHLDLYGCQIRSFQPFGKLKNLRSITMDSCEVANGIDNFGYLPDVDFITVCDQSGADLSWLEWFPNLRTFGLHQMCTKDKSIDLAPVAKAAELTSLSIMTPYGLEALKNLELLTALKLTELSVDFACDPAFICRFKELRALELSGPNTAGDFRFLLELQNLERLTLSVDAYFDTAFLCELPALGKVTLYKNQ